MDTKVYAVKILTGDDRYDFEYLLFESNNIMELLIKGAYPNFKRLITKSIEDYKALAETQSDYKIDLQKAFIFEE